jgi:hypothetical protein
VAGTFAAPNWASQLFSELPECSSSFFWRAAFLILILDNCKTKERQKPKTKYKNSSPRIKPVEIKTVEQKTITIAPVPIATIISGIKRIKLERRMPMMPEKTTSEGLYHSVKKPAAILQIMPEIRIKRIINRLSGQV